MGVIIDITQVQASSKAVAQASLQQQERQGTTSFSSPRPRRVSQSIDSFQLISRSNHDNEQEHDDDGEHDNNEDVCFGW